MTKIFCAPPSKNVRLTTRGRTPHRHGFFLQLLKKGSNNGEKNTRLLNWGCFVTFQSHRMKDGHERKALETLNRLKGAKMTMATMMAIMMVMIVTLMMTMAYADTTRAAIYLWRCLLLCPASSPLIYSIFVKRSICLTRYECQHTTHIYCVILVEF